MEPKVINHRLTREYRHSVAIKRLNELDAVCMSSTERNDEEFQEKLLDMIEHLIHDIYK